MSSSAKPVVSQSVTPYLCTADAAAALEFYKKAFGAVELMRLAEPGGKVGHAEIKLADSIIMLADEYPDHGVISPKTLGGSPVTVHVYVDDVDELFAQAIANGATVLRPVADQFYGDRSGQLEDPFGHRWTFATRKEDVSIEETQSRFDDLMKRGDPGEAEATAKHGRQVQAKLRTVTPYLIVTELDKLIDFLKGAFGGEELMRAKGTAGGTHAEVRIGDSIVMIGETVDAAKTYNATIYLHMNDVDATYKRAVEAGGVSISEPADQPYGSRTGAVKDPSGNSWYIATPLEGGA